MTEEIKTAYLLRDLSTELFIAKHNAIKSRDIKLYNALIGIMKKADGETLLKQFAEWQKKQIW